MSGVREDYIRRKVPHPNNKDAINSCFLIRCWDRMMTRVHQPSTFKPAFIILNSAAGEMSPALIQYILNHPTMGLHSEPARNLLVNGSQPSEGRMEQI